MKLTIDQILVILRALDYYEGREENTMEEDLKVRTIEDILEEALRSKNKEN